MKGGHQEGYYNLTRSRKIGWILIILKENFHNLRDIESQARYCIYMNIFLSPSHTF